MPDFAVIYYNEVSAAYEFVKGPNVNQTFTAVDGTQAAAAACLVNDKNGKFVAFNTAGPNKATYLTSFEPANSNLLFTADAAGIAGNSIRIRYVVAGNNTVLSVSVSTNDITVNLATNGSGVPTSTATQIKAAIDASGPAAALIDTTHAPGSTGAGVPDSAFTFRNLEYGSSGAAIATIVTQVEATSTSPTTF
jgi:hypothetical protein